MPNHRVRTVYYGPYRFQEGPDGYVQVYIDGACSRNGQPNASAGVGVYFGHRHPLNVSRPVHGRPTNNVAEIEAAIEAIQIADECGIQQLDIITDSKFLINSVERWLWKWLKNGWRTLNGGVVKNKHEFLQLYRELNGSVEVDWIHVEAHSGIVGNECADRLAKAGAIVYRQQHYCY